MSGIRTNKIKEKLNQGSITTTLMGIANADQVDQLGPANFDGVWIEAEHGGTDYGEISDLTRACDLWSKTSITRVNQNEPGVIYRTLDRGSQGICVPHVNTKTEAEAVVEAAKFAPIGNRGMFTSRQGYGVDNYFLQANNQTLLIILIEDIKAVENLEEILTVDHIDVFFVAPNDLASTMGYIGRSSDKFVQDIIDETLSRISKSGKTPGTLATNQNVEHYKNLGVRFFSTSINQWLISGYDDFAAVLGK